MKKIYGIVAAVGILLTLIPVSATAYPVAQVEQNAVMKNEVGIQNQYRIGQQQPAFDGEPTADTALPYYVKVRGVWGYEGDNESDGYFGGRITRRHCVGVFRGLWNTTDNETKGSLIGIMKRGYFNGRVTNANGDTCHITGLYKIDRENKTLKLRWMTPHKNGWAVAKLILPDE